VTLEWLGRPSTYSGSRSTGSLQRQGGQRRNRNRLLPISALLTAEVRQARLRCVMPTSARPFAGGSARGASHRACRRLDPLALPTCAVSIWPESAV